MLKHDAPVTMTLKAGDCAAIAEAFAEKAEQATREFRFAEAARHWRIATSMSSCCGDHAAVTYLQNAQAARQRAEWERTGTWPANEETRT